MVSMPEEEKPISPEILAKLGLNEEKVRKLREKRAAELQVRTAVARENGSNAYDTLVNKRESLTRVELSSGSIDVGKIEYPDQLPSVLADKWKELSQSPQAPGLEPQIRAYVEAFGLAAAEHRHYYTAILALNFASKDGILNNESAILRLLSIANNSRDPEGQLLQIAESLQTLRDNPNCPILKSVEQLPATFPKFPVSPPPSVSETPAQ